MICAFEGALAVDILNLRFAGNTLGEWGRAGLVLGGLWLFFILLSRFLLGRMKRTADAEPARIRDLALSEAGKLAIPVFLPCSLLLASRFIEVGQRAHTWLLYLLTAGITFRLVRFCQSLIGFALDHALSEAHGDRRSELAALRNLSWIFSALLWSLAGIFLLDNAGVNVSSALAGLGIGGIAIALSAQKILGDLFASVGILMDKPFRIGDLIGVHDPMLAPERAGSDAPLGTVERIGLKTTRIRGVNGEELILPNSSLAAARISNFSRARRRRVSIALQLAPSTPGAQRRAVSTWIAEALATVPGAGFESVRFSLEEPAGSYQVSYSVPANDPGFTIDAEHQANLAILERLEREGVALSSAARGI